MVSASSVVYTGIAIGSCFLYSLPLLLAARFLLGVMHPASLQTGYILGGCGLLKEWSEGSEGVGVGGRKREKQ